MDPTYHFRTLLMGIHRLLDSRILLHYNVAMLENLIQSIPAGPGSYLLWLGLPGELELSVGQLGAFRFPAGDYLYLGSAHGPGGLRARLGRHLRGDGKTHWHIDYLREAVSVHAVGWQKAAKGLPGRLECSWSQELAALPSNTVPAPGFGASDCRAGCATHLVHFPPGALQDPAQITDQTGLILRII